MAMMIDWHAHHTAPEVAERIRELEARPHLHPAPAGAAAQSAQPAAAIVPPIARQRSRSPSVPRMFHQSCESASGARSGSARSVASAA